MKKLAMVLLALALCLAMTVPALAAELLRVVDRADLLTDAQEEELLEELDQISARHWADVVVVTVDTLEGKTPMAYADDFYDYNGYGYGDDYSGVLLLVSMEDRDWWISTTGFGIGAITDAGIDYIGDRVVPYLSDGDYDQAFHTFADLCDEFFRQARSGRPYDTGHMPKEPFGVVTNLLIALVVGLVVAMIATGIMRGQLRSVRGQSGAGDYVRPDSLQITNRRDLFLYRQVRRRPRPKESSGGGSRTHSSSSGRSHGGGGGKF